MGQQQPQHPPYPHHTDSEIKGVLALDCDGVLFDTMKEDILCIHNALCMMKEMRGRLGLTEPLSPMELLERYEDIASVLRAVITYRPFVRLAEFYLAPIALGLEGKLDPQKPPRDREAGAAIAAFMADSDNARLIHKFRTLFYRARAEAKERDYKGWKALSRPYPGIKDVIEQAMKTGYRLCVVTGRNEPSTEELLRIHNIPITEIYGRGYSTDKARILHDIWERVRAMPVFIDDSLQNVKDCQGVSRSYLASWGYVTNEAVEEARANAIAVLDTPAEINSVL